MAGRKGANYRRNATIRRCGVVMGGAVGAFVAAAAMATGSAAPAKADFEDLLDPIIQPLLTSFTDSVAVFDPAAALDLTSWTDSLLASLNTSFDVALPSTDTAAAAAASGAEPAAAAASLPSTVDIPITPAEVTEPTIQGSVDGGGNVPLLVDTGSSGLVIPYTDLGSSASNSFEKLLELGFPVSGGIAGFTGGNAPEYLYLTYDTTVSYVTQSGTLATENVPVEVDVFSLPTVDSDPSTYFTELFDNSALQDFLQGNDVSGILGIGDGVSGDTVASPLAAAGFTGVTVDLPQNELIATTTGNPFTAIDTLPSGGATPTSALTETVTTSAGHVVGTGSVSDDVDSGGVYGTIPSTISSGTVPQGDTITVYDGTKELYSYVVGTNSLNQSESPVVFTPTGTGASGIDSGYLPFAEHPIYLDYTNHTLSFDN